MALKEIGSRLTDRVESLVWKRSAEADNILNLALLAQGSEETEREFRERLWRAKDLTDIHHQLSGVLNFIDSEISSRVDLRERQVIPSDSPILNDRQKAVVTLFSAVGKVPTSQNSTHEDQIALTGYLFQIPHFSQRQEQADQMQDTITQCLQEGYIKENDGHLYLTSKIDASL